MILAFKRAVGTIEYASLKTVESVDRQVLKAVLSSQSRSTKLPYLSKIASGRSEFMRGRSLD
jgi:hypothetical protein